MIRSRKLLAELLPKQVAHCKGLMGTAQAILIRFDSFAGENNKTRDNAKRVIIVVRGFFMRLLKLGVEVLIL